MTVVSFYGPCGKYWKALSLHCHKPCNYCSLDRIIFTLAFGKVVEGLDVIDAIKGGDIIEKIKSRRFNSKLQILMPLDKNIQRHFFTSVLSKLSKLQRESLRAVSGPRNYLS